LGNESQAKKDNGHRPHAESEGGAAQVQEWLPDGRAEGKSGTGECGECFEGVNVVGGLRIRGVGNGRGGDGWQML